MLNDVSQAVIDEMPEGPWTANQARQAMRRTAVLSAPRWADAMWSRLMDGRSVLVIAVDGGNATKEQANTAIEQLYGVLANEIGGMFDHIADTLEMKTRTERELFAHECYEAMQARWRDLVMATPMGVAGRA